MCAAAWAVRAARRAPRWPTRHIPPASTGHTCGGEASERSSRSRKTKDSTAATAARPGGRPPSFDPERYRERNTVERCFNKLESFGAVVTRYDKRERIYQGTIDVASIRIWLRDPVT